MLSRVADSIYWINRYVERAENYARFLSVNINLSLDAPGLFTEQWEPILTATADSNTFKLYYDEASRENVITYLTLDSRNPNSIYSCLAAARENARTIRETLPKELWEHLNGLYIKVKNSYGNRAIIAENPLPFCDEIKFSCQLFWGIIDSSVTRNEGFHFGRLGKFLERADKTSRFLDVQYFTVLPEAEVSGTPKELLIWSAVLKSVSAFNMYRQQYKNLTPSQIIKFLILDKNFPRSVLYSLRRAEMSLYEISGVKIFDGYSNSAEKVISRLRYDVEFADINEIIAGGLHSYLDNFQIASNKIGDAIFDNYFDLKLVE